MRASNEHSFTVRVLRARRAPGCALPILLRPRVARAKETNGPPLFPPFAPCPPSESSEVPAESPLSGSPVLTFLNSLVGVP